MRDSTGLMAPFLLSGERRATRFLISRRAEILAGALEEATLGVALDLPGIADSSSFGGRGSAMQNPTPPYTPELCRRLVELVRSGRRTG